MTNTHLDKIVIDITLGASGNQNGFTTDFSKILIVDTKAQSTLAGMSPVTVATGSKLVEIFQDDVLTADVGSDAQDVINGVFGAASHPESVWLLAVDLVGGDTRATAILGLESVLSDYYGVLPVSVTDTVIAEFPTAIIQAGITRRHVVFAGLADSAKAGEANGTWITDPIGFLSAAKRERTFITYHDDNLAGTADFAEAAALYLTADFDTECPGGNLILANTQKMAALTPTLKSNMEANYVNIALEMPGVDCYLDAGVNQASGRPIYQIFSADWFENKLQIGFANLKVEYALRRRKLPMDSVGQNLCLSIINGFYEQGIRAKHFLSDTEIENRGLAPKIIRAETISDADITARRLRFTVSGYFLDDARQFSIGIFLTS